MSYSKTKSGRWYEISSEPFETYEEAEVFRKKIPYVKPDPMERINWTEEDQNGKFRVYSKWINCNCL